MMTMPNHCPRILIVSHGHPSFSLGGAEIAAYNLHKGLNKIGGAESRFLARVGYPVVRHSDETHGARRSRADAGRKKGPALTGPR